MIVSAFVLLKVSELPLTPFSIKPGLATPSINRQVKPL